MFFVDQKKGLKELRHDGLPQPFKWGGMLSRSGVAAALNEVIRPKGPGSCDHNATERVTNIITALPYIGVGVHTIRKRKTSAGKIYGGSQIGVGLASVLFHASKGKWRALARKIDYWTCALSATAMSRCVYPKMPNLLVGLSLGITPFRPLAVSSLNTFAMEAKFVEHSMENDHLMPCQLWHNAAAVSGISVFALEDRYPKAPLLHSTWHLLSCVALATTNGLLADVERRSAADRMDDPFCHY